MRPQLLVTPKKGKLLGAKENEGFVDTFDWMKNVCDNLKGDGISIEVDRTDEDAPTIRLTENVMNRISDLSAGGDDCDLTAYYAAGGDNHRVATWYKGGRAVDIYSPSNDSDVQLMYMYLSRTPFFYDLQARKIVNCYFYDGRKFVTLSDYSAASTGTYYLKIEVGSQGARTYSIVTMIGHTSPTDNVPNTDSETYYKIWTVATSGQVFDWRPTFRLPFYSEV